MRKESERDNIKLRITYKANNVSVEEIRGD